jgi:hypothetical protein
LQHAKRAFKKGGQAMNEYGLENLRVAILQQAAKDYISALRHNEGAQAYRLEKFFKSEWGELLSNNHGDFIISECKKRANRH